MTETTKDLNQELQFFKTRFESALNPLIVFDPASATLDQAALATSLHLVFQNRPSTTPTLLALSDLLVEHSALVGINQATTSLPTEGLVITLDNSDNSIGNISCDADENNRQLRIYIKSQNNKTVLDPEKIDFQPLTIEPDLIIGIGVSDLQALRQLGITNFSAQNTLFLQPSALEHVYTFDPIQANLTSSYSEFLAVLFRHWVWPINQDIATNLLMGIDQATNNFSKPDLSPSAFEAAGWLLRQGGQRYLPELAAQQIAKPVAPEAIPQFSGFDFDENSSQSSSSPSRSINKSSASISQSPFPRANDNSNRPPSHNSRRPKPHNRSPRRSPQQNSASARSESNNSPQPRN